MSGQISSDRLGGSILDGGSSRLLNRLEAAIEQSQAYLLSVQKPEGYWVGELMVDATLVADTIARRGLTLAKDSLGLVPVRAASGAP